jgi:hypothetical protein
MAAHFPPLSSIYKSFQKNLSTLQDIRINISSSFINLQNRLIFMDL